jgi:quinoprotein glucose dehydrogenase
LWDLDLPGPPVLASINKDGRKLDVVVAVTKAGNTLILDRESGEPIFEQRFRRAPTSKIPGERTAAYQPDFQWPEPFAKQAFTIDDVTNISNESRHSVLQQLENTNFGFYAPHELGKKTVFFGLHGGAMQMGPGLDQKTGILYIASTHEPSMFTIKSVRPSNEKRADQKITGYREFLTHCASCHGSSHNAGASAPSLEAVSNRFNDVSLKQIIRRGYQSMPAVTNISDIEIDRLLSYFLAARQTSPEITESMSQAPAEGLSIFTRTAYQKLRDREGYPGSRPPWGTLNALDLNSGRIVWRVPLGRYQALIDKGLPLTGTENMGGPMVTAGGLVFVSGTKDLLIRAFDSESGKVLWEHALPFVGSASPMTYEHKGQQFIVIPATGGGTLALYDSRVATGGSFVAFRLGDTPIGVTN